LTGKIEAFEKGAVAGVRERLRWAGTIDGLTRAHPGARVTWEQARRSIAEADDVVAGRLYAGRAIALADADVIGLVPIGMNPVTKLWEFYELRSAWDGRSDPAAIPIPVHRPDGSIEVTGETGIVFVLLPGGTFRMGAVRGAEVGPNVDPQAQNAESPVHEVTLAPFFLARHELTKGQWKRLSGGGEPSWYRIGAIYEREPEEAIGYAHPVEQVDWMMSFEVLRHHGLLLPTEAQWEYGCRAGSTTPWWPGPEAKDLAGCANVLDQRAERVQLAWGRQEGDFDDGRVTIGPVSSYRPNGFGLYDVHGNVWEWCLDEYGSYAGPVRAGDGLRLRGDGSSYRVNRGGSFGLPAVLARSASRHGYTPTLCGNALGLRPARTFQP
jgi:formylglycine-generating enzyme required for sulfatase activity